MTYFLHILYQIAEHNYFVFATILFAFCMKTYFLFSLFKKLPEQTKTPKPWLFLIGILTGALFSDIAWLAKLTRTLLLPGIPYALITFLIRIAYFSVIIQYQSLALFMQSLTEKNFKISPTNGITLITSGILSSYFLYIAIFDTHLTNESSRLSALSLPIISSAPFEMRAMEISLLYILFLLIIPGLLATLIRLKKQTIPKILRKQLKIFVVCLILPFCISESLQAGHFLFKTLKDYIYPIVSLATLLLTFALYFCMRKVMGLRFLNFSSHVQSVQQFNFVSTFKGVLEQLSHVTSMQELTHITKTFCKETFEVPLKEANLYIRESRDHNDFLPAQNSTQSIADNFLSNHDHKICSYIQKHKILIYDEIAFSNFYEEDEVREIILKFLDTINADVFLPIWEKQKIISYIVIDRFARQIEFYSDVERDEMLVFASYLGNIINLLQSRNIELLIHQEKELREELYEKHQEINQYKESIRSFFRSTSEKQIGIIFFKNRHFTLGNQAAKELIKINPNTQEGHAITKALKNIVRSVMEYKTPQQLMINDTQGNKLILSGVPHLEQNNVIITVYYPEISDIVKRQMDLIKDPTKWDYLLYLETTQSGQLINQLIPSHSEAFLNFKIELLHGALSKKALLLQLPEEDLTPTVELIHHISLRTTLFVLTLQAPSKNYDTAIKLFGVNPLLGINNQERPLLEKLDGSGTLFIQNIHFLDLETQKYLAEYIKYGYFHTFKSDQKASSNVRIVCSTNQNLYTKVQEGTFSQELFDELKEMHLSMPSLVTLPDVEIANLAQEFTEQSIKTQTFKNLLELTDKEKQKLAHKRPTSLKELKTKVQHLLIQKSKKNQIYQETQFDPAYAVTDPDLIQAARLGKHALKDHKTMVLLWNKFQNQNKIAMFLGVNRSSVNRRCKDFDLQ